MCVTRYIPIARRRGFSFTEVLFAVVILGIGFIMVAAIFPVAIQQSKLTINETTGASLARGATSFVERAMTDLDRSVSPPTASDNASNCKPLVEATSARSKVQQPSFIAPTAGGNPALMTALRGNQILPEDPRYAFVALYRRSGTGVTDPVAASAQIYTFCVQATAKSLFKDIENLVPQDTLQPSGPLNTRPTVVGSVITAAENNLMAHSVKVAIIHNVPELGGVDLVAFDTTTTGAAAAIPNDLQLFNVLGPVGGNGLGAPVEGGYLIIASDHLTTAANEGRMNGSIYKIGAMRTDLDVATYFPSTGSYKPFSTLKTGVIFELDPSTPFIHDAGADGITHHYASDPVPPALDDIVGLGNDASLAANLPASQTDPTVPPLMSRPQMTPVGSTAMGTADAFVVGRSYVEPSNPSLGYEGGSMVIGIYTTFVKVN